MRVCVSEREKERVCVVCVERECVCCEIIIIYKREKVVCKSKTQTKVCVCVGGRGYEPEVERVCVCCEIISKRGKVAGMSE